jgi:hypothetical protein
MGDAKRTSADLRAALRRTYTHPEHALVFEVAQATGYNARRHLDAVVMELWPSRGLTLHGIEIKVSRSDWRREKQTPEKAEEMARFCDCFSIAAPAGLVPHAELPSAWGLIEVDEAGRLRQVIAPTRTEAQAVDRAFLAAMLRASQRPVDPAEVESVLVERRRHLEASFDERVRIEADRLTSRNDSDAVHWRQLLEAIGEDAGQFYKEADLIKAVAAVFKTGAANTWHGLGALVTTVSKFQEQLQKVAAELNLEQPDDVALALARHRKRKR